MAMRDQFIEKIRYEIIENCQGELLDEYQKIVEKVKCTIPDFFKLPHPKEFYLELRGIQLLNNLNHCGHLADAKETVMRYWSITMEELMEYALYTETEKNTDACFQSLWATWDAFLVEVALLHIAPLDKPRDLDSDKAKEAFKSLRTNQGLINNGHWVAPFFEDQEAEVWKWAWGERRKEHRELTIVKLRELLQSLRETFGWLQTRRLVYRLTREKAATSSAPKRRCLPPPPILNRSHVGKPALSEDNNNVPEIDSAGGVKQTATRPSTPTLGPSLRNKQPGSASLQIPNASRTARRNEDSTPSKTNDSSPNPRTRYGGPPDEPGDSVQIPIDLCTSPSPKAPPKNSSPTTKSIGSETEEENPPSLENSLNKSSPVKRFRRRSRRRRRRRVSNLGFLNYGREDTDELWVPSDSKPKKKRRKKQFVKASKHPVKPVFPIAQKKSHQQSSLKPVAAASIKNVKVKVKKEYKRGLWTKAERDALWEGLMVYPPEENAAKGLKGCWSHIKEDQRWENILKNRTSLQMKDKARAWKKSGALQRELDRRRKQGL